MLHFFILTFQCLKLLNRFFSACFHMFGTCLIFFILLHCKFMHIIFSSFFSDTSLTQTFICKILCFMILSREFIFQAILPFYKFSHLFFFSFSASFPFSFFISFFSFFLLFFSSFLFFFISVCLPFLFFFVPSPPSSRESAHLRTLQTVNNI